MSREFLRSQEISLFGCARLSFSRLTLKSGRRELPARASHLEHPEPALRHGFDVDDYYRMAEGPFSKYPDPLSSVVIEL